MQNKLAGKEHF